MTGKSERSTPQHYRVTGREFNPDPKSRKIEDRKFHRKLTSDIGHFSFNSPKASLSIYESNGLFEI